MLPCLVVEDAVHSNVDTSRGSDGYTHIEPLVRVLAVAEPSVLVKVENHGDRQVFWGVSNCVARYGHRGGISCYDMFTDTCGSRNSHAANPYEIQLLSVEVRRRCSERLGDNVLVLAVEERDQGARPAETVQPELGKGSQAGIRSGRQHSGRDGLGGFRVV